MFVFSFRTFCLLFRVFSVSALFCVLFLPMYMVVIFYLCTNVPTSANGRKTNYS
jgi:hypothetical protein